MSPYRARLYRLVFAAAAVYNIAFGLWAAAFPRSFFTLFELAPPVYPAIWACLGMVVGLYGVGYGYAALHLDRAAPFIAIGLLGKVLGPIGWLQTVTSGEWPVRTVTLVLFNDVIWWVPFALFLLDGRRGAALVRASAPYACAAIHLVAAVTMAAVLRHGTEAVPVVAERIAYISAHALVWRAGWAAWVAAAVSLVAFYAWWGSYLRDTRWAIAAVSIAAAGMVCDLFAESLLIGWLPRDYERLAPMTTMLTAGAANSLYTIAGILLTLSTPSLPRPLLILTWTVWLAGGSMTMAALSRNPVALAISTAMLLAALCPWAVWLGRTLQSRDAAAAHP